MKNFKGFIAGVITTVLLISLVITVFAAPETKTVTVTFGATKYFLDGEPFTEETLVYNGVAYLPAAYLATKLGLTACWNSTTNTTNITTKPETQPPIQVAAPSGTLIIEDNPIKFSGTGDKVVTGINIPVGSFYAVMTHNGSRNFISKLFTEMANTITYHYLGSIR